MQIRTSVKVINPENSRVGTAGLVWANVTDPAADILVKFDEDGAEILVPVADLVAL